MRKTIFTLIAGTALTAGLLLASCHGKVTISGDNGTDTLEFNTDSIREININVKTNEEGEADGTEAMGLALYEAEAMDISELPETAKKQDRQGKLVLYVNIQQASTPFGWQTRRRAKSARFSPPTPQLEVFGTR